MPPGIAIATVGLACSMLLIGLVFLLGTWSLTTPGAGLPDADAGPRPGAFAHTLVPIAAGYAIAHYFSLLVFDGQLVLILASDPFASGANLLGTAGRTINYTVVSTSTIATVQVTSSTSCAGVGRSRRSVSPVGKPPLARFSRYHGFDVLDAS